MVFIEARGKRSRHGCKTKCRADILRSGASSRLLATAANEGLEGHSPSKIQRSARYGRAYLMTSKGKRINPKN